MAEVFKVKKPGARHWLGLIVLALPALLLVPGIGFETDDPAALARRSGENGVWYYRVQAGDSLTTIAERHLGTFKRFKDILALNPGIKPRALQLGDVLRMPPPGPDPTDGASDRREAPKESPDAHRLLLSLAGLLVLVVLIVLLAGRFDRRLETRT